MSVNRPKKFFRVYFSPEREVDNFMHALWLEHPFPIHGFGMKKIRSVDNSPEWFQREFKKCRYDWQARSVISKLVKYLIENAPQSIEELESQVEKTINRKSEEFTKIVETAYGEDFPYQHVNVFLTLPTLCPTFPEDKAFSLSLSAPNMWREIIIHELNHLMFYYYYPFGNLSEKISRDQYCVLLEALTVVTNLEEEGYPGEKKLRKHIRALMQRGYNFNQIVEELLVNELLLDKKADQAVNEPKRYGFLDRLSIVYHDLKRKYYEDGRGIR
jgi:hypothetical protein